MNYIVRSGSNPKMILTRNGGFKPEVQIGPGGYSAMIYRTKFGAQRAAALVRGTIEESLSPVETARAAVVEAARAFLMPEVFLSGMERAKGVTAFGSGGGEEYVVTAQQWRALSNALAALDAKGSESDE